MSNELDLDRMRDWLIRRQNYRESTALLTVRQTQHAHDLWLRSSGKIDPPATSRVSLKRALAYCTEHGIDGPFVAYLRDNTTARRRTVAATGRKREAKSFSEDEYRALRIACTQHRDREAYVLNVLLSTGLRIGDVLRLPAADLHRCIDAADRGGECMLPLERKGGSWIQVPIQGALDEWRDLDELVRLGDYRNIADFVTDGADDSALAGSLAYNRVDTAFRKLCKELDIGGRAHLHRIRRTVAVRALNATGRDLVGVQQLLAHKSIAATQRYVDEIDAERVAQIQKLIR